MNLPNTLSSLRIILAPIFMVLFLSDDPFKVQVSFFVFAFAALTDWYDGWYARRYGFKTKWGRFLDPLADKILTSAAFLAFYFLNEKEPGYFGDNEPIPIIILVAIIILRDIILTLIRGFKELKGVEFVTARAAKIKTFLQMTFIFLFIGLIFIDITFPAVNGSIREFLYSDITYYFLVVIALITLYSGIQYFFEKESTDRGNA